MKTIITIFILFFIIRTVNSQNIQIYKKSGNMISVNLTEVNKITVNRYKPVTVNIIVANTHHDTIIKVDSNITFQYKKDTLYSSVKQTMPVKVTYKVDTIKKIDTIIVVKKQQLNTIVLQKTDNSVLTFQFSELDSISFGKSKKSDTTVSDIDNNTYNTVRIGSQVWMKENLKAIHYNNGDIIATSYDTIRNTKGKPKIVIVNLRKRVDMQPLPSLDLTKFDQPKFQWSYSNKDSIQNIYGKLYTWYSITDKRGVCPTGFHVPTDAEFTTLTDYLGGETVAGGKMKEPSLHFWQTPNAGADTSIANSHFTAIPAGYRVDTGTFDTFLTYASFWTSTEGFGGSNYAWNRYLYFLGGDVSPNGYGYKGFGFSVRCLKN